ncbi:MAG: choice-of-anchor J domain-containing protein [Bacteroidales bacterium]|nr:choice-of-anchor J domain-containing protein [Bacteroidales bacterium]
MTNFFRFSARVLTILMIMLAVGVPPGTATPSDKLPSGGFVPDMLPNDSVVIGTSTQTNLTTPVNSYYGYSFTQTLYFQSELNFQDKVIERVGYHYAGTTVGLDYQIEIWIGHTQLTSLAQTVQLTDFTKVYDGIWICNPGNAFSSVEINPFFYNNQDNLIITVIEKKPGYTSPTDVFYSTPVEVGKNWCLHAYNDNTPYNPENLSVSSPVVFRANTKLWLNDVPTGPAVSEITPLSLDFGIVELGVGKTKQVKIKNTGADPLQITGFSSSNDVFQVINTTFPLVIGMNESQYVDIEFMPVEVPLQNGTITFEMDAAIAGDRQVEVAGAGVFLEPVVIGAGTEETYQVPLNAYYGYSFSQTLYLQEEIDMSGKTINRIGYQYAGPSASVDFLIEVWITHTSLTEISASVPLTGFTKVYDGPYVVLQEDDFSWVEIDPFFYNNNDNLIITIIEKKPGYTSSSDVFMATPVTTGNMCVAEWNDSAPYDPNALPAGSVVALRANTKLWFSGDIPTEPEAKTTPASLYFGEVETSVTKTLTVEVMNAGGGILEITGATITNPAFTVINATFPVALPIGQKETFEIQFAPVEPGLEEGLLTFEMDESIPGSKTVDLSGRALRFGVLREGFEGETFPPLGWKVIDNNNDSKGWLRNTTSAPTGQTVPHTGVAAAGLHTYAGSPNQISYDDWLITPRMIWQDGDVFKFYIKRLANQAGQKWRICLSTSGTDVSDFTVIDEIVDPPRVYGEKLYDLSEYGLYDGDKFHIGIQFYSVWCWPGVVDDVLGSVLDRYENDLMVMDFTGPDLLYQNASGNYEVKIANYGLSAVAPDAYQTQICAYINGIETVLASLPGQALDVSEIATVTIPLSMADEGVYDIYAKILWSEDMEPNNNFSDMIALEVIQASIVVKNIGQFPITPQTQYNYNYPIDFEDYRRASLTECLYYKNELNTGGVIERITYYTQFGSDMNQRKIKIWIGETDQNSLENAYIPPSQLKLVFDGKMDFDEGIGKVNFELTEPYVYAGGGNLVVNVYYYDGTSDNSNSKFAYTQASGYVRTVYESGWQTINPETALEFNALTQYPNTSFMFQTGAGVGALSGTVYYLADNAPVQAAKVEIYNPDFPDATAVVYTNAQGSYNAPYALAGSNLTVTVSKFGYVDKVYENVNLPVGGNVNLGSAYLGERTKIALSGSVYTSDTQEPVRFATVKLFGMEDYEATTGVTGEFVFDEIWGSTAYQIEISYEGYQTYIAEIFAPDTDFTLDPITILENAPAPNLVNAQVQGSDAVINWYAAGQPYPMVFRYDDGVVRGRLITPGTPTIFGGAAWPYNAIINSVTWFNFPSESYPASPEVRIIILGVTEDGTPDANNQLALIEEVPQVYGWNTYQLEVSVDAPDGFFVGIAGYSDYTVLGYDDGVGEPYEWMPRTNWSNGLGAYTPLESATSPPLRASIMVRAGGLVYGDTDKQFAPIATSITMPANDQSLLSICQATEPFDAGDPEIILPYASSSPDRSFMHYHVFSKALESPDWVQVNTAPVYDTLFIDTQWSEKTFGLYQYGVEAEYTNGVKSLMAESNVIEKNMRLDLTLIVNTNTGVAGVSAGALVKLINQNGNVNDIYNAVVEADGSVLIEGVKKGIYDLEITLAGFDDYLELDIDLMIEAIALEKTVELIENLFDPYDLEVITEGQLSGVAKFKWNQEPVFDNVDGYAPFLIDNIGDWTVVDQDMQPTVTIAGISFPHTGDPFGFITLNRTLTTPPLSEVYWGAHSGNQYFAAFASAQGNTSNWLISPEQNHTLPYTFSFYAKSVNDAYGLETFRIAYSTGTTNLSEFVYITGNVSTLTYWNKFSYTIPAEAKYVAIRHTHTGFALLIDDITLGVQADGAAPANGYTVLLDGQEVATGWMDNEYNFTALTPGEYIAGVKSVFYTGESNIVEKAFTMPEGLPITFNITDDLNQPVDMASVKIYYDDELVFDDFSQTGTITTELYPGTYYYEISKETLATATGSFTVVNAPLTVSIVLNNYYDVTFIVKSSNNQLVDDATVVFDNQSQTTFGGQVQFVTIPGTFGYAVTHPDYGHALGTLTITGEVTQEVVLPAISCEAPTNLTYEKDNNNVTLQWDAPDPGSSGTWLHWDYAWDGNSVGTGGVVDFDVAQRFAPADLQTHNGKFLTRVFFVPKEEACAYSVRVWIGGNINDPGMLVVDQAVVNPLIGEWNEIFLNTPVYVDATQELWIGFRSNTTTGHPAGCDIGPAIDGKGNMINLAGTGWQTLLEVAPTLNYNWSVRGLLQTSDADHQAMLTPIADETTKSYDDAPLLLHKKAVDGFEQPRQLLGYNVYRSGVIVNTAPVINTTFSDELATGTYIYEVSAVYSNGCESEMSNAVAVEISPLFPAVNLLATVAGTDVSLTWQAPASVQPDGYKVYRDGVAISGVLQTVVYLDASVGAGSHFYFVTAVYGADESVPSNTVQVLIEGALGKIQGFVRDATTNYAVTNAIITASNPANGSITQATPFGAHYSLMLPAGTYDVACAAEGYADATVYAVEIVAGANTEHTFYLQPQPDVISGLTGQKSEKFRLYPNPATDVLFIEGGFSEGSSVVITDQLGKALLRQELQSNNNQVDVAGLPGGIYLVKLTIENGAPFIYKLIIE